MSDRDDFGAFLMGFIIGGLTGAAASLLLAPQSGEETRTIIRDKAIELRDRTSETVEEAYGQAEAAAQDAVRRAESLLAQARSRAEEVQRQARSRAEDMQRHGQMTLEKQSGSQVFADKIEQVTDEVEKKADDLEQKGDQFAQG